MSKKILILLVILVTTIIVTVFVGKNIIFKPTMQRGEIATTEEFIRIYTPKSPDPLKDFKSKFQKWSWFDGKDSLVYLTQKEMKKLNIKTGKVSVVKKYSEKLNLSDFTLLSPDKKWLVYDVSEDRIITVWARNIEEDKELRLFNQSQNVLSCGANVACWFGE